MAFEVVLKWVWVFGDSCFCMAFSDPDHQLANLHNHCTTLPSCLNLNSIKTCSPRHYKISIPQYPCDNTATQSIIQGLKLVIVEPSMTAEPTDGLTTLAASAWGSTIHPFTKSHWQQDSRGLPDRIAHKNVEPAAPLAQSDGFVLGAITTSVHKAPRYP